MCQVIGRTVYLADLLRINKTSGQSTPFGVLRQNDQREKTTNDKDDDGDGDHGDHAVDRRWCFDYLFS